MSNYLPALTNGNGGFLNYLHEINKIPSLEADEEYMLAKRFSEHQDVFSAQKLVTSHLKLVAKIAMGFRNYGLPVVELISEGNIGLMQAVKKFDVEKGFRLSTYAIWWIKAAIQEYILKSWSLVKIGTTAAQKKLFFNLGKIKRKLFNIEARDLDSRDYGRVAAELNVSEADVAEMNVRMKQDRYLDEPIHDEDGENLIDIIPESRENYENILARKQESLSRRKMLYSAMTQLNERERYIVKARKLQEKPSTLDELSHHFKVSKERVRQIEEKAMSKLKEYMTTQAALLS